ncbi:hypothetical protein ABPG77_003980 [Micractinium sp. CCAP 211/92]
MGGSPCFTCVDKFRKDTWQELKGQPFRDDSFTDHDWQRHLTWRRYIPEPSVSGVVALTLAPVWMWSVLVSMCLGLYATYAEPNGAPNVSGHKDLITPFSLTSFALSLLMLFKTNSSYSRWWEARTLWGSGYITVRSILRLVISFVGRDTPHLVAPLYRWTAALMPAMAAYLRQREHYIDEHLKGVLLPAELDYLRTRLKGGIPPIAVLQIMSRLLDQAQLADMERQQLEHLLNQFDIIIGGNERILKQAVPYAYNRHTHRFILCYITFLPFAFWPLFKWFTLPVMALFTFLITGAENVGVQIEEPHRVLPLNQICAGSLRALRLMMADLDSSAAMAASSAAGCDASLAPPAVMVHLGGERPHKGDGEQGGAAAGGDGDSSWANGPAGPGHRQVELSAPSAGSTLAAAQPASHDPAWSMSNGRV